MAPMNDHTFSQTFPSTRLRRLRQSGWIRDLVAEHKLASSDLIWSVIVHDGDAPLVPVPSMPGV
ncbi:MAG: hypothetical protein AAF683_13585, partial [Pseudomonadota bacterium]